MSFLGVCGFGLAIFGMLEIIFGFADWRFVAVGLVLILSGMIWMAAGHIAETIKHGRRSQVDER